MKTRKSLEAKDKKGVFLIENGKERKVGETTEEIRYIHLQGKLAILREQLLHSDVLGNRSGVTIVEEATFKPISFTDSTEGKTRVKALYTDGKVEVCTSKGVRVIELENESCFDAFSIEMILRIIPLHLGYSFHCNAFNAIHESEVDIDIEVVGKESVHKGSGKFTDAWKVKVCFGDTVQFYWISMEGKELLKQSSQVGEGIQLEFRRV